MKIEKTITYRETYELTSSDILIALGIEDMASGEVAFKRKDGYRLPMDIKSKLTIEVTRVKENPN